LAETCGARIFLHDFEGGAEGLTVQLQRLAASLEVDRLVVVDVGGDIVARGSEPDLRSPLADSLTLAAALGAGLPTLVVVIGPGVDAELPERDVLGLLEEFGGEAVGSITAVDVRGLEAVLSWHPTEATALVAAGAGGIRGRVAMRRGRDPVPVTARTPTIWAVSSATFDSFPLAGALQGTTSLPEVEVVMREVAVDEIDFERQVSAEGQTARPGRDLEGLILDMEAVGATHITGRRLSEILARAASDNLVAVTSRELHGLWSKADLMRVAGPFNEWR
jgi:hypothetical protein